MSRDCDDVACVSRNYYLEGAEEGLGRALEGAGGESGLRRRSVCRAGTITWKVRRRASAGHSRVQGGESGLRLRSVRESGTIFKGGKAPPEAVSGRGPHIQQRLLIAPPSIVG